MFLIKSDTSLGIPKGRMVRGHEKREVMRRRMKVTEAKNR